MYLKYENSKSQKGNEIWSIYVSEFESGILYHVLSGTKRLIKNFLTSDQKYF